MIQIADQAIDLSLKFFLSKRLVYLWDLEKIDFVRKVSIYVFGAKFNGLQSLLPLVTKRTILMIITSPSPEALVHYQCMYRNNTKYGMILDKAEDFARRHFPFLNRALRCPWKKGRQKLFINKILNSSKTCN